MKSRVSSPETRLFSKKHLSYNLPYVKLSPDLQQGTHLVSLFQLPYLITDKMLPATKYFRPIRATAELELRGRIDRLLELNPTISATAAAWEVRQIGADRWHVEQRAGCLWLYRAAENLKGRTPLGVVFWDEAPR